MPIWPDYLREFLRERFAPNETFSLADVYELAPRFQQLYPTNNTIEAKLRQTLQVLRDDQTLDFGDHAGQYRLRPWPLAPAPVSLTGVAEPAPTAPLWLIARLVPVEEGTRQRPDDQFPGLAVRPSVALGMAVQRAAQAVAALSTNLTDLPLLTIPLPLGEARILTSEESPSEAVVEALEEGWGWASITSNAPSPLLTPLVLVSAQHVRLAAGSADGLPYYISPALPLTAWPAIAPSH